jgi:hypothetical protein
MRQVQINPSDLQKRGRDIQQVSRLTKNHDHDILLAMVVQIEKGMKTPNIQRETWKM